ncbi:MAG TPA: PilZ domain-containing protein [Egibacteraceae bacterium]
MPIPSATVVEPPPRAPLSVRCGDDGDPLGSFLHGTREGLLVIAAPTDADGVPLAAEVGQELTVSWAANGGVTRVPAAVIDLAAGDPGTPLWLLQVTGPPEVAQRREFFRARADGDLSLAAGRRELPARLLDLSEGGLRCRVKGPAPASQGETLTAVLSLDGSDIVAETAVVRATPSLDGRTELALRFVDLGERSAEVIRRHLFRQQLRQRRSGLS